jgi:hypothetical protein
MQGPGELYEVLHDLFDDDYLPTSLVEIPARARQLNDLGG